MSQLEEEGLPKSCLGLMILEACVEGRYEADSQKEVNNIAGNKRSNNGSSNETSTDRNANMTAATNVRVMMVNLL